jgi:hypothetical protein
MSKVVMVWVMEERKSAILEPRSPRGHHKTHATRNLGSNSKVVSVFHQASYRLELAVATESVQALARAGG